MRTDYKFAYIMRNDDGLITEAGVRFYEGEVTTENEKDIDGNLVPVTRYRRSRKLNGVELGHLKSKRFVKEQTGDFAIQYTSKDFGEIKTDEELVVFLDKEIKKDKTRIYNK